jgi:hypothetical protein
MLLTVNPSTDEALVDEYRKFADISFIPMASESGIRSRRAELVAQGRIQAVGFDKTRSGRKTTVWGVK